MRFDILFTIYSTLASRQKRCFHACPLSFICGILYPLHDNFIKIDKPMTPIFDINCDLVGWISDRYNHIFDVDMTWVAYIAKGHAWSSANDSWCGPVTGSTCRDQKGKVVACNPSEGIKGASMTAEPPKPARTPTPPTPAKPATPARPVIPPTPAGGWSNLSFGQWAHQ